MKLLILSVSMILFSKTMAKIDHHQRVDLDKVYSENSQEVVEEKKSYGALLIIGNQISSVSIDHSETSSATSFFSLGEKSSVKVHSLGIKLGYELFRGSRFSLTPYLSIGKTIGREEETIKLSDDTSAKVRDSVNANRYGYGGTVNFNTTISKEKIQFFAGLFIYNENRKYELIYGRESSGAASINFESELDYTITQTSLGMRWFASNKDIYSQFSLNMDSYSSSGRVDRFFVNQSEGSFSNSTAFDESAFSLGLGFGVLL